MDKHLFTNAAHGLSRRQFLSLAGGIAAGSLLAACAPATGSAPGEEAAVSSGEDVTQLVAWFTDRRTINVMTEEVAIPGFESANPGIQVELQFVPESELQQKLLTAHAAGNAPDVSSIDETFLDTLQKEGVFQPIPEDIDLIDVEEEMGALVADFYRIPHGDPEARYYALPNGLFSAMLYYNAGLLDELGYTPEDIPNTWDNFLEWAKEVTVWEGDELVRSGFAFYENENSLVNDLRHHIAGPIDGNLYPTSDSVAHADGAGVEAWQFTMDLYDVHRLDSREEGLGSRERFGGGRAVILFNWTWFNGFMDTQYEDIEWGLVLQPTFTGNPVYGTRGPDVGFTVTTQNEDHLEESWTFWRYLLSPAYLSMYCKLRGIQPSLKEMWDDPAFSAEAGPQWGPIATRNRPENSIMWGFTPLELGDINGRILPSIRDEGEDIVTVLQRAEEAANEFLQANPQWSILSREDYLANPEWMTSAG